MFSSFAKGWGGGGAQVDDGGMSGADAAQWCGRRRGDEAATFLLFCVSTKKAHAVSSSHMRPVFGRQALRARRASRDAGF